MTKLTRSLAARLNDAPPDEAVEVVLELNTSESLPDAGETRAQKIAKLKDQFAHESAEVEQAIRNVGGEVTAGAWITNSVRAKIPARSVDYVAELHRVRVADVPHAIERD